MSEFDSTGGPGPSGAEERRLATREQPRVFFAALRHYFPLLLVVAALVAAGVTLAARNQVEQGTDIEYRATALVIAEVLELRPELLPKTAAEIFETSAVANRAVEVADIPYEPSEILPRHADIQPVENSVVIRIIGIDNDPAIAAEVANGMAQATVAELNRAGPGLGVFAVQDLARPPDQPVPRQQLPLSTAVGVASGVVLAFGLLGLAMALGKPLFAKEQVAAVIGAPSLGEIMVPANTRSVRDPITFLGLGAHIDALETVLLSDTDTMPRKAIQVAYVSSQVDRLLRGQLAAFLASELANSRDTHYLSVDGTRTPWNTDLVGQAQLEVTFGTPSLYRTDPETTLIVDGPASDFVDLDQVIPHQLPVVLVVPEGRARQRVVWIRRQLRPDSVIGFVFVRKIPGWRLGRVWWRQIAIAWRNRRRDKELSARDRV